ncbi:hypothetical protein MMC08_000438 [Hypocenomyce scalaris]|nr:hypothetical protein [Hypocenomyce scalaris]
MSISPTRRQPRAAFCEDYNEDDKTTVPDTRRTANTAAKRSSKPDFKPEKVGKDGASDSGYSSQTAATVDSGGSSQRSRLGLAPLTAGTVETNKLELPESKTESAARKTPPKIPLHTSVSRKQGQERTQRGECNCRDCILKNRASVTPLESRPPQDYFTLNPTSRPRCSVPPLPQSGRPPPPGHAQQTPFVATTQARSRPLPAQSHRIPRPMSFQGGPVPEVVYMPPPQAYGERRPQPLYVAPPAFPPPSYPPTSATYIPSPVQAVPPTYSVPSPYDQTRPQPRQWPTELYPHPSRRSSMYENPIIQYDRQQTSHTTATPPHPSSQPPPRGASFHRERPAHPIESYYERDEDSYQMPPPPPRPPTSSQQRPTIRHSATTSAAHPTLYHRRSIDESPQPLSTKAEISRRPTPRESVPGQEPRSRRQSLAARPSAGPARASYTSAPNERILVERAARSGRRASYFGQDHGGLERKIEAYQEETRNAPGIPIYTTHTLDSIKQGSKNTKTNGSGTGSRSSTRSGGQSREGSDVKPNSRGSSRVVASPSEGDGFTMRFNAGVKVDVKGDGVEGRTISFRQTGEGDGSMEVCIGGRKGSDEGSERSDRHRGTKKYHGHSGAATYSNSAAPSRSGSLMRSNSNVKEGEETLRVGGWSREVEDGAGRERKIVRTWSQSRRSSPTKEFEDLTIRERQLVRSRSQSRRSSRSGYSGRGVGD